MTKQTQNIAVIKSVCFPDPHVVSSAGGFDWRERIQHSQSQVCTIYSFGDSLDSMHNVLHGLSGVHGKVRKITNDGV